MNIDAMPAARIDTAGKAKDVRGDHVARYRWAAARLAGTRGAVIDAGCNCGYGAAILADAGLTVLALDNWPAGLDFARANWDRPSISWGEAELDRRELTLPLCDAVVAFEVLEHLATPESLLRAARAASPVLLASVPNEAVWPHRPRLAPVHKRHYRKHEFATLLRATGWSQIDWFGQSTGYSSVEHDVDGRTLVVACR